MQLITNIKISNHTFINIIKILLLSFYLEIVINIFIHNFI
jgi:hypothetical protein